MRQVRLKGKTNKGKTRIGTSGDVWDIMEGPKTVPCTPTESFLIRSLDGRDWRWVELTGDPNFIVEVL
jgi:hypothetical protein